jgi:hypothetical protein
VITAGDYLEEQRPDYGKVFESEVDVAIEDFIRDPQRWPVRESGFRRYVIQQFGYLIWYRESNEEIYVIAVHHSSQEPGYWKDRILDEQR